MPQGTLRNRCVVILSALLLAATPTRNASSYMNASACPVLDGETPGARAADDLECRLTEAVLDPRVVDRTGRGHDSLASHPVGEPTRRDRVLDEQLPHGAVVREREVDLLLARSRPRERGDDHVHAPRRQCSDAARGRHARELDSRPRAEGPLRELASDFDVIAAIAPARVLPAERRRVALDDLPLAARLHRSRQSEELWLAGNASVPALPVGAAEPNVAAAAVARPKTTMRIASRFIPPLLLV